jgi:hypothetical protein
LVGSGHDHTAVTSVSFAMNPVIRSQRPESSSATT